MMRHGFFIVFFAFLSVTGIQTISPFPSAGLSLAAAQEKRSATKAPATGTADAQRIRKTESTIRSDQQNLAKLQKELKNRQDLFKELTAELKKRQVQLDEKKSNSMNQPREKKRVKQRR